jgi:Ca2+-binding RTX toxin-like protein
MARTATPRGHTLPRGGKGGDDILYGNDDIFAQESDTLRGGAGDDTLHGEFADTIDGGTGTDTLVADNSYDWTIDLTASGIEIFYAA